MQMFPRHAITLSILFAGLASLPAVAQVPEVGVWINHEGKGAVEIKPCGPALCGNIVWLREPLNEQGQPLFDRRNPEESKRTRPICGLPVIGNVRRTSEGWDEGWIYNPEEGAQYDVYLRASGDRLTVTGYKGVKLFSKTFTWTRAPADLQRCEAAGKQTKAKPPTAPVKAAATPPGAEAPAKKPTAKAVPAGQGKAATQQAASTKQPVAKDTVKAKAATTPKPTAAGTNTPAAKPTTAKTTTAKAPTPKPAVRPAPQAAADKTAPAKKAAAPGAPTAPKAAATKPAAAKPAVAKKKTADEIEASSAVE